MTEDKIEVAESIEAEIQDLAESVEELPPLPTEEEAEMGELCRKSQFGHCDLLEGSERSFKAMFGELDEPKGSTDEEVEAAIEAEEGTILAEIQAEFEGIGE
jgi:hypothetical protein